MIDTPGLLDFIGHGIACLPAVETVAVVVDPIKGIEATTQHVMAILEDRQLPP